MFDTNGGEGRGRRKMKETQSLTLTGKEGDTYPYTVSPNTLPLSIGPRVLALCFHSQKWKWGVAEPDGVALLLVSGQRERERGSGRRIT